MSSVDTAWLHMDSTTNLMMIVGVMTFDTPLSLARLKTLLEGRLLVYPRFRQYVVDDGMTAHWVDDDKFDLDAHVRRVRLPGAGGERELQSMVADLASERLDKGKPLWQMHVIENYNGGSALITRIHHCIADGIALDRCTAQHDRRRPERAGHAARASGARQIKGQEVQQGASSPTSILSALGPIGEQFQGMLAPAMQALAPVAGVAQQAFDQLGPLKAPIENALETAMDEGARIGSTVVAKYNRWVDNPAEAMDTAKMVGGFAQELAFLATMPNDTPTQLKGKPGTVKCVAWASRSAWSASRMWAMCSAVRSTMLLLASVAVPFVAIWWSVATRSPDTCCVRSCRSTCDRQARSTNSAISSVSSGSSCRLVRPIRWPGV